MAWLCVCQESPELSLLPYVSNSHRLAKLSFILLQTNIKIITKHITYIECYGSSINHNMYSVLLYTQLPIELASFVDHLCYFCLFWLCFRARLFIDALWSPARKRLTSWLSFVMSNCEVVTFPLVSLVRCGA